MSSTADEQSDILEIKYPKHTQLNLSFMFVIVCGLFEWKRICAGFFLSFVYICIAVGDPVIKREGLEIQLSRGEG